ncbi:MAG TPA: GGDEF domain-containing response regulator [bacterium]
MDTTSTSTGTDTNSTLRVLLVEDDRDNAHLIEEMLAAEASAEVALVRFDLETCSRLAEGVKRLSQGGVEAVLLDLSLPDSQGLRSLSALREQAPHVPIVVLTGSADKNLGIQAVEAGAQDYLVKGRTDGALLVRSLRYAIDRKRLERILEQQALIDELSGVYNRRAFFKTAEQQLRLLRRFRKQALLVLVDIDGLKEINDAFGHAAGDVAVVDAVGLLRNTFRESDIIGRMGGDEFAVLAFEVGPEDMTTIPRRLTKSLAAYNKTPDRRARLAFSLGFAVVKSESGSSLGHLLKEAEEDIDLKKHGRPRPSGKPPLKLELS